MITTAIENITPEIAKEMLSHNIANYRSLDKRRVAVYASDMSKGLWELNGEAIVFDEEGTLKNGQHRLHAILASKTTQSICVIRGVSKDIQIFDSGKTRTISQIANAKGITLDNGLAGAVGIINHGLNSSIRYGKGEAIDYFNTHSHNFTKAKLLTCRGNTKPILRKAAIMAAIYCALVLRVLEDKQIEAFCQICNSGMPQDGYIPDAPLKLRLTIQEGFRNEATGAIVTAGGSSYRYYFEATWQALLAFKEGRKPKTRFKPDGHGEEIIQKVIAVSEMLEKAEQKSRETSDNDA